MKPGPVHPQENSWNWTQPDALVDFCQASNIKTFGHCLVWHSQTNAWFFQDADRDRTLARLRDHIHTLVGRFKGKMSGWDVAREVRTLARGARPVLIAISGTYVKTPDVILARAVGFSHFLPKPCNPNFLLNVLAAVTPGR